MASPERIETSRSADSPPRSTPILRCPIILSRVTSAGPSKNCTAIANADELDGSVVKTGAMTFLEAALEVLRLEGKPLHYKELTERVIGKKLLTFVGRTPEVTMQTQLTAAVKKAPGNPFVRVKPGIFGLLRYPEVTRRRAGGGRSRRGQAGRGAAASGARARAMTAAPAGERGRRRRRGGRRPRGRS